MKYAAVLNVFGPGWLFLDPDCNQLNSSYLVTIDFFFLFFFFTSSSFSSKDLSRCWGITSLKPFCRARNWASMPCRKRQFTYNLQEKREHENITGSPTATHWGHRDGVMHRFIPDILLLGVLRHWNCLAIWFELMLDDFSVSIVLDTESMIQDTSDVVVPEEVEWRRKKLLWPQFFALMYLQY